MKFSFLLFLFFEFISIVFANLAQQRKLCSNRCHRLLKRSLERIEQVGTVEEILYRTNAYSHHQFLTLLKQNAGTSSTHFEQLPEPFQSICWKFFDFEDCSRQCEKAFFRRRKRKNGQKTEEDETNSPIEREQRKVLQFCHRNNLSVPPAYFSCIHKFHAFVEIRCSSYQQKAVQLRLMVLQNQQRPIDESESAKNDDGIVSNEDEGAEDRHHLSDAIDKEVCLLLHQHSTCLGNALGRHCPFARSLFANRHALRDNFLSFVLPFGTAMERRKEHNANAAEQNSAANLNDGAIELDQLFSDEMLDMCQLLDFNKMLSQWEEQQRDGDTSTDDQPQSKNAIRRGTTKRAVGTVPTTTERAKVPSGTLAGQRRVFSSDEDLLDIPPNFHFSSARLPPDFYTRYAIWWGGRSRPAAAHSTLVQLLPEMMPKTAVVHYPKWPYTTTTMTTPTTTETPPMTVTRTTWPDPMLTSQLPNAYETMLMQGLPVEVQNSVTLPYMINGLVTVPNANWNNVQATSAVERRTEIRLLKGDSQRLQTSTTGSSSSRRTTPAARTVTAPIVWSLDTEENQIHKLPNEAEGRNGDKVPTNWPRHNTKETEQLTQLRTDANNVYFAKILQFDEEEEENNEQGWGSIGTEKPQGGRVTAYMEHIPREEQLKPMPKQQQNGAERQRHFEEEDDSYAEEDYFEDDQQSDGEKDDRSTEGGDEDDENWSKEGDDLPYKISTTRSASAGWSRSTPSTAAASGGGGGGLADLSPKSRVPLGNHRLGGQSPPTSNGGGSPRRIVVTAEPVPGTHSDVLLVLLGLYGIFFGVAAFLLLCLLLACLERRRRRHGLLGHYRRKYCLKNTSGKKGGSAILYLDERLGTVKRVEGK